MAANSVMAIESIPAVTRGASTAATVPCISRNAVEMMSTMAGTNCASGRSWAGRALKTWVCSASICPRRQVGDDALSSDREPAMDHSDGWSNKRVWGSAVSRRSLSRVESAVAAMESSPVDMRGTSAEMIVPTSSEVKTARSGSRPSSSDSWAYGRRPHYATRRAWRSHPPPSLHRDSERHRFPRTYLGARRSLQKAA